MSNYRSSQYILATAVCLFGLASTASGFTVSTSPNAHTGRQSTSLFSTVAKGFGTTKEQTKKSDTSSSSNKIKQDLLELIPRMTGSQEDYSKVEQWVNALEAQYAPTQTLGFFNLAVAGEWQLLFSTNLAKVANPAQFRLREMIQTITPDQLQGSLSNQVVWDLAEDMDGKFDATGTFTVQCNYTIAQGSRMQVDLQDHILKPATGSKIPTDVPGLVGRLHRSMPKELFDPSEHSMDTTYLDVDLRIVRLTGPRLEGVRGIFIRRGAWQIDPTGSAAAATEDKDEESLQ